MRESTQPRVLEEEAVAASARQLVSELRALGVSTGDRVAVCCGTAPAFVAARDAVTAAEAMMVPVNPKLTAPEMRYLLEHSGAGAVLAEPALVDTARRAAPQGTAVRALDDVADAPPARSAESSPREAIDRRRIGATLIYTSGTTGRPKGCVRTEDQELARAEEIIATYGLGPQDTHLVACPLAHSAPGIFVRAARRVGARTLLLPKFEPSAFLATAAEYRATVFFLVPTQYERLLSMPDADRRAWDLSAVRAAIVAGAPIHAETKRRLVDWLGPGILWEFYGSSETGTISVLRPEEQLERPGSVGRPVAGVELRVLTERGERAAPGEVGEIYVDAPSVMSGYLDPESGYPRDPDPQHRGISVGDLGRLDEEGYLYLVDRKHDTIITGGVNVYPAEVERALADHPDVIASVVAGVEDPTWGQRVAALVGTRSSALTAAKLRAFLREQLAPFKIPKQIELADPEEIPIGSSGKRLRREAARRLAAP